MVDQYDMNIVKDTWITACTERGFLLELEPAYMIYANQQLEAYFRDCLDEFNDHFTQPVDEKGLLEILDQMIEAQPQPEAADLDHQVRAIINEVSCSALAGRKVWIDGMPNPLASAGTFDSATSEEQKLSDAFLESSSLQTFLEVEQLRFLGAVLVSSAAAADIIITNKSAKGSACVSHQQLKQLFQNQQSKW